VGQYPWLLPVVVLSTIVASFIATVGGLIAAEWWSFPGAGMGVVLLYRLSLRLLREPDPAG
jgi:hypothetical protein